MKFKKVKQHIPMERYMEDNFPSLRGRKQGNNIYYRCPIHRGTDYNFVVNTAYDKATCFSHNCVKFADVVKLHSQIHNLSQINAVDDLLKMYGLQEDNSFATREKNYNLKRQYKVRIEQIDKELLELETKAFLNQTSKNNEFENLWKEIYRLRDLKAYLERKIGELNE